MTISPHQVGLGPDMRALARDLDTKLMKQPETRAVVTLRLGQTLPKLTTEKARAMGITDRLSTFTTDFDPGNKPRVNNIRTLAKAIDGSLIPPGATWSFNGQVGERTAAKGYKEANAIVNGKLVPQLGGGICQVATTVFNAIFFSGEPVVERSNHSFYISHYPKGRDATVNWGGPDLKFKNDTGHYILLKTSTSASSIQVSLFGTSPGYHVTYKTGPLTQTGGYPTQQTSDPHLPVGTTVVQDSGSAQLQHHGHAHGHEERDRGTHRYLRVTLQAQDRGRARRHDAPHASTRETDDADDPDRRQLGVGALPGAARDEGGGNVPACR